MNILETIIAHKFKEVEERKKEMPTDKLMQAEYYARPCLSLINIVKSGTTTGVITEFKRKSPSKGFINEHANVVEVTKGYTKAGAACLSVLTDSYYFGGSTEDLLAARVNKIPILRKDFIIDEYQITEAKAMGADVILLIAACLTPENVKSLAAFAVSIGLEVLLELHSEQELQHICGDTILVGINNRNLKDFKVDVNASMQMAEKIPAGKIKIAESGISNVETLKAFKDAGFQGFLIGETFMKEPDPALAFYTFAQKIRLL